jgi:phosphoserine phosphatase RsbU/P
MRILIADDDQISRSFLAHSLENWGYDVIARSDGDAAWRVLDGVDPPPLAVLDWMMPGREGVEICRLVRDRPTPIPTYVILLTAKTEKEDLVAGLAAGADDYLAKPFDASELRARLQVGVRLIALQQSLATRVKELQAALDQVKQLHGMLPMCAWCKKVRTDSNYWQQIDEYITEHSEASFSHGICPQCVANMPMRTQDRP